MKNLLALTSQQIPVLDQTNQGLFDLSDGQLFAKFIALPFKFDRIIVSIKKTTDNLKSYLSNYKNKKIISKKDETINLLSKVLVTTKTFKNTYSTIINELFIKISKMKNKKQISNYIKNFENKLNDIDEILSIIHSSIRRRFRETIQISTNLDLVNNYSINFSKKHKTNQIQLTEDQLLGEILNYILDSLNFIYFTTKNNKWILNSNKFIPRFMIKKNYKEVSKKDYWFSVFSKQSQLQNWTYKMFSSELYYNLIKKRKIKVIDGKIIDRNFSFSNIDDSRKYKYDYYYTDYKQTNKPNSIIILQDGSVLHLEDKDFKQTLINKFPSYSLIDKKLIKDFHDDELIFSLLLISYILNKSNTLLWNILKFDSTFNALLRFKNCSIKFVIKEILANFENVCKQLAITELLGFETMFGFTTTEQYNQRLSLENDVTDLVKFKEYNNQLVNNDIYDLIIFDYVEGTGIQKRNLYDILNKGYLANLHISDYMALTNYYTDGSSGKNKVKVNEFSKTRSLDDKLNKIKNKSITKTELINCFGEVESEDGIDYVYKKSERLKIRIIFAGNLNTYYPMSRLVNTIIRSMRNQLSIYPLISYDKRNLFAKIGSEYMNKNLENFMLGKQPEYIFLSVDFSSFDHDIKFKTIIDILGHLINAMGKFTSQDIRDKMNEDLLYIKNYNTKVMFDNKEYKYYDGMLSGWKVTNSIESILNIYFCSLCIKDMSDLVEHVFTSGMGDDNSTILKRKLLNEKDSADVINIRYKTSIESYGFKYNEKKSYPSYYIFEWLKQIFSADEMKDYGFRAWCSVMFRQPTSTITTLNLNELMMLAYNLYDVSPYSTRLNECIKTILSTSKVNSFRQNVNNIINGNYKIKNNRKYIYKIDIDIKNTAIYNALNFILPNITSISDELEKIYLYKSINEEQVQLEFNKKSTTSKIHKKNLQNITDTLFIVENQLIDRKVNISSLTSQFNLMSEFKNKLRLRILPSINDYNLQEIIDIYCTKMNKLSTDDFIISINEIIRKIKTLSNNNFKSFFGLNTCTQTIDYLRYIIELKIENKIIKWIKYKKNLDLMKITFNKRPSNSYLYKKYFELFKQNFDIMFDNNIIITKNMITNAKTKIGIYARLSEYENFDD